MATSLKEDDNQKYNHGEFYHIFRKVSKVQIYLRRVTLAYDNEIGSGVIYACPKKGTNVFLDYRGIDLEDLTISDQ